MQVMPDTRDAALSAVAQQQFAVRCRRHEPLGERFRETGGPALHGATVRHHLFRGRRVLSAGMRIASRERDGCKPVLSLSFPESARRAGRPGFSRYVPGGPHVDRRMAWVGPCGP